jgi:acetylornithine deacetylase/succinyl-diaminopimelate desuccinylase-like protein
MKIASSLAITCWITLAASAWAQDAQSVVDRISNHSAVRSAQQFVDSDHDRFIREIITINEVAAPPFKEAERARAFAQLLRDSGLQNVEIDPEGNVLGLRKGTGGGPLIAVAAHLDTVFPEGTDVKVRREGNRLMAPGIGDNARSLAVLLSCLQSSARWKAQRSRRQATFSLSET